jgi:hypothetical protein
MRTIRASEFGTFIYCQRAWWYYKNGIIPENEEQLASGLKLHARHGQMVATTGCIRALAYLLLLIALVITVIYITLQFI